MYANGPFLAHIIFYSFFLCWYECVCVASVFAFYTEFVIMIAIRNIFSQNVERVKAIEKARKRERKSVSTLNGNNGVLQKHIIHLPAAVSNSQGAENLCIQSHLKPEARQFRINFTHSGWNTRIGTNSHNEIFLLAKEAKRQRATIYIQTHTELSNNRNKKLIINHGKIITVVDENKKTEATKKQWKNE